MPHQARRRPPRRATSSARRSAAAAIHGDLRQGTREQALADFTERQDARRSSPPTSPPAASTSTASTSSCTTTRPRTTRPTCTARAARPAPATPASRSRSSLWNEENSVRVLQKRLGLAQPIIELFSNDPRLADLASLASEVRRGAGRVQPGTARPCTGGPAGRRSSRRDLHVGLDRLPDTGARAVAAVDDGEPAAAHHLARARGDGRGGEPGRAARRAPAARRARRARRARTQDDDRLARQSAAPPSSRRRRRAPSRAAHATALVRGRLPAARRRSGRRGDRAR